MNNIKQIREIYGATQEQVAKVLGVNRVTIANWENNTSVASSANREKMSIYFGIGPEFFYDKELDEAAKRLLVDTSNKAKQVFEETQGKRNKEDDFYKLLSSTTFAEAMQKYMFSMKVLLAVSDNGELDKLKTASLINKKMGARLDAIIEIRKKEISNGEPSISELLETLDE